MKTKSTSTPQVTAHVWLIQNHYDDIAAKIDRVESRWRRQGKRTRRNWWDVLAGHKDGSPKRIEGVTFPVLRTARLRKGWPVADGGVCRNSQESFPSITPQARWLNRAVETN
jgi:hypothetical protein